MFFQYGIYCVKDCVKIGLRRDEPCSCQKIDIVLDDMRMKVVRIEMDAAQHLMMPALPVSQKADDFPHTVRKASQLAGFFFRQRNDELKELPAP